MLFYSKDTDTSDVSSRYVSDDTLGMGLIAANSVAFLLIFVACWQGVRRIATVLSGERIKWASDGAPIELRPPQKGDGYHLFLSHVWAHGEKCGTATSHRSLGGASIDEFHS